MKKTKMKFNSMRGNAALVVLLVILVVAIAALVLAVGYFSNWKCVSGEWKKHGFPLSTRPQDGCAISPPIQPLLEDEIIRSGYDNASPEMEQMALEAESPEASGLEVINIKQDDVVASPLIVSGRAKGTWYFEGEFPIRIMDGQGNFFAEGNAIAKGEWMTPNWVPFEATLKFQKPSTKNGFLYLMKNDPSGMPQNSYSVSVPIRFGN
jgi:hypothetical protein